MCMQHSNVKVHELLGRLNWALSMEIMFGEKFLQQQTHLGEREIVDCVEEFEKYHKFSLAEGLIESALAEDA